MAGNKRIPDLLALYPNFIPDVADAVVVYDESEDETKAVLLSNLVSGGINGQLFKILSANANGGNVATVQPWFPSNGGVAVAANTTYLFEGTLRLSRAAGTTSHTTSLLFGGSATLTGIQYVAETNTGDTVANAALDAIAGEVATAIVVKAASTSATEQVMIHVTGVVRVNAAGTFIPQFQYSAAPGGVPSVLANSNFRLYPVGDKAVVSAGTWA